MISSCRLLVCSFAVLLTGVLVLLVPQAQARVVCEAGSEASLTTIHTSCAEAKAVIGKGIKKYPIPEFRVYVRGYWHCSFSEIAGHTTFTAERKYGTPQRQVVIWVTE